MFIGTRYGDVSTCTSAVSHISTCFYFSESWLLYSYEDLDFLSLSIQQHHLILSLSGALNGLFFFFFLTFTETVMQTKYHSLAGQEL